MPDDTKQKIIENIEEEAERIGFGKLLIEVVIIKGRCISFQIETRKNVQLENRN